MSPAFLGPAFATTAASDAGPEPPRGVVAVTAASWAGVLVASRLELGRERSS